MPLGRALSTLLPAMFALFLAFRPAAAQRDTVTVTAGPQYRAGSLKSMLLGDDYRDLWTTPIRVPVLDLASFAGGLTPVERGSGMQTISLRFQAANGTEYNFRSVDKDQSGGLHPDFRNTAIDRLAQDQVSSKHPVGALITAPLLDALGILHPNPRLFVMPDDPRLGEYRQTFAGMLGYLEIHPNEGPGDTPGFAGSDRVADAETLLEHLEETAEHRPDSRAYLRARLVDLLVGDWDRHPGQWRWARYPRSEGGYSWVPVPEDRDNAFSSYDGLLLSMARSATPHLTEFSATYPPVSALVHNAQLLDRWILSDLPGEAFAEVAAEVQRKLADEVLEQAVANTPPALFDLRGAELLRELRARRDALPRIARAYFALLAREVDVHATDEDGRAVAERHEDGSVEVRLYPDPEGEAKPYFVRRFRPEETREVRIYLHGGDDVAVVRGAGGSGGVGIRVLGGGDDDFMADSSTAGSALTAFYDADGDNRFGTTGGTVVDQREFVEPEAESGGFNENAPPFRDWGKEVRWFSPWADWRYNVGPVVGGGPVYTRYGFRRVPYARRITARALYGPVHTRFGFELAGEIRHTNSPSRITFSGHATQLEVTRFHGFGNESVDEGPSDRFKVWETEYMVAAAYHLRFGAAAELFAGPLLRYTRPELEEGGPADLLRPFGSEPFGEAGGRAGIRIDTRDAPSYPRGGLVVEATATAYPAIWDAPDAYGRLDGAVASYLPLPLPLESTLALRAGGSAAWGEYPLQQAAFLGGSGSLRGTPRQRFAGDAAAWAGAELRTFLTRFNFISRGDLGLILLADAGRVFVEGESSDRVHTGLGGGIWMGILDRSRTASLTFASGTEEAIYLTLGMPF